MAEAKMIFSKENGDCFRIPSLVNADGVLIAVADNGKTGADWGYIELAMRRSDDAGETWNDVKTIAAPPARMINSDINNTKSAFFIDPCMGVAPNGDIILLVTFFPESKGCHDMKYLEKKKTACANVGRQRFPLIYDRDGNFFYILDDGTVLDKRKRETDYTVSGIGELYKGEEYLGNIYLNGAKGKASEGHKTTFGAPLKAPKRSFIFMMKSSDQGLTWSQPKDITRHILGEKDGAFLGVCPGTALVTKSGRMIFPLYTPKETVCIYTDDNGETWNRNQRVPYTQNQGEWTAIEAPDRIYAFGRGSGKVPCTVSFDNGILWNKADKPKFKAPKCQKNAIVIGEQILVSHPSGSKRENGVLSVGEFVYDKRDQFKEIEWRKEDVKINDGYFAYSCLAKIDESTLGILYEDQPSGHIVFAKISLI